MKTVANRLGISTALLGALALGACGGDGPDPVVGTWTYSGDVPNHVNINLTLNADKSFTFAEEVAPVTTPAGLPPNPCVTTHTYLGTYAATLSGGTNTLTWAFMGGTRNAISMCGSNDSAGTPMTDADIIASRGQGLIPPAACTYAVTSTTLVVTSMVSGGVGIGDSPGTTFTRAP